MAEIEYQGLYAHGKLEGVDFTVAGKGTDSNGASISWNSSISLNLSTLEKISKEVNGQKVSTYAKRPFLIKLDCDTDDLMTEVEKWNKQKDKMLHLRLQPSKNSSFRLSEA